MTKLQTRPTSGDPTITARELRGSLRDPAVAIVDVRPLAAFNGWRLTGGPRGGHIPGAVAFPAAWLSSVDEPEVRRLLASKGIAPDRSIVVYGDAPHDTDGVLARLRQL